MLKNIQTLKMLKNPIFVPYMRESDENGLFYAHYRGENEPSPTFIKSKMSHHPPSSKVK